MIRPSNIVAALTYVDEAQALRGKDVIDVGREIWRVTAGSRYELWSVFATARGMPGVAAEAKWRTFLSEPDGPDVIERMAREGGWDGGFDRSPTAEEMPADSLWDDMVMSTCGSYVSDHVVSPPRVPIGIGSLNDELGGGIAAGTYTVVGGEGGCGKTALGTFVAYVAMASGDYSPLVYSLEVTEGEVMDRMLSVYTRAEGAELGLEPTWWASSHEDVATRGVDQRAAWSLDQRGRDELVRGYVAEHGTSDPTLAAFMAFSREYAGRYAIRTHVTNVEDICAEIDQVAAEGVRVMPVIDHINVIDPPGGSDGRSEYERVTAVSHALMACAKRNRIPMLVLAEIRNVGEKERDTPRLNWFRGSGHVGYDAGCAVILTSDEARGRDGVVRPIRANVVKNRHGRSGASVPLRFNGATNTFLGE